MGKELYVGNIPFDATEEALERLFSVSGKVLSVRLISDQVSGRFTGCAYIRMSSSDEAVDAVHSLDGALMGNRTITVAESRPKSERAKTPAVSDRTTNKPGRRAR